jgi:hypothetical protein
MIPMKLTENHYINPEAIDQLLIRPKTDERPPEPRRSCPARYVHRPVWDPGARLPPQVSSP